jgi:uncharacterized membrane protein
MENTRKTIRSVCRWQTLAAAVLLSALCCISRPLSAQPPSYILTDLGTTGGFAVSSAIGISENGTIVGTLTGFMSPTDPTRRSFVFQHGQMRFIDGDYQNLTSGASDNGIVAGTFTHGQWNRAFASPGPILPGDDLGTLRRNNNDPTGYIGDSLAAAINSAGDIGGVTSDGTGDAHAIIFKGAGSISDLGSLPLGGSVNGISSNGTIVGVASGAGGGVFVGAPGFNVPITFYPYCINDLREVAGQNPFGNGHAYVWNAQQGQIDLSLIARDGSGGPANAINNGGDVVGAEGSSAALWQKQPDGSYRYYDLNNLVVGGDSGFLEQATGINSSGQIVGTAAFPGGVHAFLLTPITTIDTLVLDSDFVPAGVTTGGTIYLTGPAPPEGLVVTLLSDNPSATVPESVTIEGGQMQAHFDISTDKLSNDTTANITASDGDISRTAALDITALLDSVSVIEGGPYWGGFPLTGEVILGDFSPQTDTVVSLASSDPSLVSIPATVTVPAHSPDMTFPITTFPVNADTQVDISATFGPKTVHFLLTLSPVEVTLTLNQSVCGRLPVSATIEISAPAPEDGLTFSLVSSDPSVANVPQSVTIQQGEMTASFTVETMAVAQNQDVTITAASDTGLQAGTTLTVMPLVKSVSLNPTSVYGGDSTFCTLQLNCILPEGLALDFPVSSDHPEAVTVPMSITVPGGADHVTFEVKTKVITQAAHAGISVKNDTAGDYKAFLDVIPGPLDATSLMHIQYGGFRFNRANGHFLQQVTLTNTSGKSISGPISLVLDHLSGNAGLFIKDGVTVVKQPLGSPYLNAPAGSLAPNTSTALILEFTDPTQQAIQYRARVLAGQGTR